MSAKLIGEATDSNFQSEVLQSPVPVLVDFWATWCGPCRALAPVIEDLANHYQGKVKVYKMDVDHNPNTPSRYGVRGIPTVILFKNGKVMEQSVGAVPKADIAQLIEKVLAA